MVINPIVGVYIPIIRVPIKGGMTIPNIATFDHGTCRKFKFLRGETEWEMEFQMFSVALGIFSFYGFGVFHWPIQWFRTTQPLDTGFDALINNSTKYHLYGCAALEDDGKYWTMMESVHVSLLMLKFYQQTLYNWIDEERCQKSLMTSQTSAKRTERPMKY